jgi:hypothetical protein
MHRGIGGCGGEGGVCRHRATARDWAEKHGGKNRLCAAAWAGRGLGRCGQDAGWGSAERAGAGVLWVGRAGRRGTNAYLPHSLFVVLQRLERHRGHLRVKPRNARVVAAAGERDATEAGKHNGLNVCKQRGGGRGCGGACTYLPTTKWFPEWCTSMEEMYRMPDVSFFTSFSSTRLYIRITRCESIIT